MQRLADELAAEELVEFIDNPQREAILFLRRIASRLFLDRNRWALSWSVASLKLYV
jgi:hypothetical protein